MRLNRGVWRPKPELHGRGKEEFRRAASSFLSIVQGKMTGRWYELEPQMDTNEHQFTVMMRRAFCKIGSGQVILPANVMFCLFQYRVRPGEQCGFTTKSTKVTKRIFCFRVLSMFRSFCAFCGHSRQRSRYRILQTPQLMNQLIGVHSWFVAPFRVFLRGPSWSFVPLRG